jgi:hypothetical protein
MYWFEKMPWENPDAYWARSPLGQSEQLYQALKIRKVDNILAWFSKYAK